MTAMTVTIIMIIHGQHNFYATVLVYCMVSTLILFLLSVPYVRQPAPSSHHMSAAQKLFRQKTGMALTAYEQ